MKNVLSAALAATLALSAGAAQAQLSAGHIMLTGTAGYSSQKDGAGDDYFKSSRGEVTPQVGYFLADNLAIGIGASYSGETREIQTKSPNFSRTTTNTMTALLVGPFVRYYKPVGERAAFFGQLGGGIGSVKVTEKLSGDLAPGQTADPDEKYSLTSAALAPGFTFFPTDHFGLEISMGGLSYNRYKLKDKPANASDSWEDDNTSTALDLKFGLQGLAIGATWYLGGK